MSIRAFAEELGGEDGQYPHLRGTSYGGVRQYVEGAVTHPRVELLRAMADVLGVRGDWLAFDEGPMTDAEERGRQAAEEGDGILERVARQMAGRTEADRTADAMRGRAGWVLQSQGTEARAAEVFTRFHAQRERLARLNDKEPPPPMQSMDLFVELLTRPLMQWRTRQGISVHPDRLLAYADAALLALSLATPDGRDFDVHNAPLPDSDPPQPQEDSDEA